LVTLAVFNTMVVASVLPQSFSNSPPMFQDVLYVTGISFSTLGVALPFNLRRDAFGGSGQNLVVDVVG
ncbi:hypothetical protein AAFO90_25035, partial [Phaeobacter sp. CAU 1743]